MGSLISALNIAKEALSAEQSALNVTASNVANANTAGYTREVANFSTQDTYLLGGYEQADGVTAGTPTSIRDRVLEQRVEQQTQAAAQSSTLETALNSVQDIFGLSASTSSSNLTAIGSSTDAFFTSLTALANDPSDTSTRQEVLSAASTLSTSFNAASTQLSQITDGLNGDALTIVGEANTLLSTIANLNAKIAVQTQGVDAGVLEDQRQTAIAQLSQYIGLDQITTAHNGIELTTSNDGLLVAGNLSYQLNASLVNGSVQITAGPNNLNVSTGLTGGSLGGTLAALDSSLPPIQNSLDTLAYAIATSLNTQNGLGVDANGNAGQPLFTIGTSATGAAGTIAVATDDPSLVAAADAGEGSSGNTNAAALAALGTAKIAGGDTASGYLGSTLAQIGEAASEATSDSTLQQANLTQLTTQRDSLSGVSLDEEASNLTEYQRSYQAASQLFRSSTRSSQVPSTSAWSRQSPRNKQQGIEEKTMRVDPFYVQGLVGALSDAQASEAQLSGQLSSGLRVTSLSTDPVAAGQATVLGSAIAADDSYVSAAATAQSKLQVTDSTLGEVVSSLTQAISLAVSGGDGTLNTAQKTSIGIQLTQLQSQILSLANTSYLGQYVFAGSQGSTEPFTQTGGTSTTPATTTYNGDTSVQYTTTENGQKIQTNVTGSSVFDAPGASVFVALNQIVTDFTSGAGADTIGADSSALTTALNTVSNQRGLIDTSLAQVQSTSTYAQTDATQQAAAISSLVAVNTAQVATSLSSTETQAQALESVIAGLEKGSLFDYVK